MQNTVIKLTEIKKKLTRLPVDKLDEVEDFVGFLLSRHKGEGKKNIRMKGIWAGKGFERIDIQKEIKRARKDLSNSIWS
jgi:mRNA-degrading endonuclease RelE of RelBE toxin-antitoxin system